ncbi:hypothetical protein OAK95_00900 [Akkermansiaceae bacterium]|nr:hypothetical protein [Akkermansiaceae bacterium]
MKRPNLDGFIKESDFPASIMTGPPTCPKNRLRIMSGKVSPRGHFTPPEL